MNPMVEPPHQLGKGRLDRLAWSWYLNQLYSRTMTMDSTALMDVYGRKLLEELQTNARLSIAELGRRIGLSPTATAERLKQTEEVGIVHGLSLIHI